MVIISLLVCIMAFLIMRKENQYTFAPSILDKPINYQVQRLYWLLIPKILIAIGCVLLFFCFEWYIAAVITVIILISYFQLNKYFAKKAISDAIEKIYPPILEGILDTHEGEVLSTDEMDEKKDFAKFLSLHQIWKISTGSEPDRQTLQSLIKTTGLTKLTRYL